LSTSQGVPSSSIPIADENGRLAAVWFRFFQSLVNQPSAVAPVTVGVSPFSYTANQAGTLAIRGGTISAVSVSRGTISVPLASSVPVVPMGQGDVVTITYTVLPTVNFLPS